MPTYDYRCETNGEVMEVNHRMNDIITTWGGNCVKKPAWGSGIHRQIHP